MDCPALDVNPTGNLRDMLEKTLPGSPTPASPMQDLGKKMQVWTTMPVMTLHKLNY